MRNRFFASVLATTMLVGLNSSPVFAAATMFLVHGIPNTEVDVCVDGEEVRSNFNYSGAIKGEGVSAGSYLIQIFRADPSECGGNKLLEHTVDLKDGQNATAVIYAEGGVPAARLFENELSLSQDGVASITFRSVARTTEKATLLDLWVGRNVLLSGVAQGEEAGPAEIPSNEVGAYWVSVTGDINPKVGPGVGDSDLNTAYQIIVIGTNATNYDAVVLKQAGIIQ